MARVYAFEGLVPVIAPSAFVHADAILIGDVIIGPDCYIGPAACLRGDFGRIIIEAGANVQDTCVLHSYPGADLVVETFGHIGHGAILHGCRIGENSLVGMNAVIMDDAVVGANACVGAQAFVKAGMVIPPGSLVVGAPARIVRQLSAEEIEGKRSGTRTYQRLAQRCLVGLVAAEPLTAVETDRPRSRWWPDR